MAFIHSATRPVEGLVVAQQESSIGFSSQRTRLLQSNTTMELTTGPTNGTTGETHGVMFDVVCFLQSLYIKSLFIETSTVDPVCPVLVYGRYGSHAGVERTSDVWTLLVNATVNCAGPNIPTQIPEKDFQTQLLLPPNGTFSLYVAMSTPNLRYTFDNGTNGVVAANPHLAIRKGVALSSAFDQINESRSFRGSVLYGLVSKNRENTSDNNFAPPEGVNGCLDDLTTTFNDNLGSYGNMFDVVTNEKEIYIYGIDVYSDVSKEITYEVYTKWNSFADDLGKDSLVAWTTLASGKIVGAGKNNPTMIRGFDPLSVPSNATLAFYVTLTTPDLRYRNVVEDFSSPPAVGDTYVENDDMRIEMGVSVGSYPLSNTFFGPRVWSGTLHYVPEGGCPSAAPSSFPTMVPMTMAPTNGPTKGEPMFEGCTRKDIIETTFDGGTGAYGNMFTVTAADEPLTITTLEFHTDFSTGNLTAVVQTKVGDYVGYENDPSVWRTIATGQVQGAGSGRGTIIPRDIFSPVHMYPTDTRSFYVTLTTADIRYTRTETPLGDSIVSNEYLSIGSGTGLANYPFASEDFLYYPRAFNGRLHFTRESECLQTTLASYSFEVEHPLARDVPTVIGLVNSVISDSLIAMMSQAEIPLSDYRTEHLLGFLEAQTVATKGDCTSSLTGYSCVVLDSSVSFEHRNSLRSSDLKIDLLNPVREKLVTNLNLGEFLVTYVGNKAKLGSILITLSGSIPGEMDSTQRTAFERAALSFLNATTGIEILGVEVMGQEFKQEEGRRNLAGWLLLRGLQRTSSSSSVEITTSISGEYRPPPEIIVEDVVNDAIDEDPSGFQGQVQRSDPYFGGVEGVKSEPATAPATLVPTQDPTSGDESKSAALPVVLSLLAVLALILGWYFWKKKRGSRKTRKSMPSDMLGSDLPWIPSSRLQVALATFRQRLGFRNKAMENLFDAYAPQAYVERAPQSEVDFVKEKEKWNDEQLAYHDPYAYTYENQQGGEEDFDDEEGADDRSFHEYEYDDR